MSREATEVRITPIETVATFEVQAYFKCSDIMELEKIEQTGVFEHIDFYITN